MVTNGGICAAAGQKRTLTIRKSPDSPVLSYATDTFPDSGI
jgi:hypothetical protein